MKTKKEILLLLLAGLILLTIVIIAFPSKDKEVVEVPPQPIEEIAALLEASTDEYAYDIRPKDSDHFMWMPNDGIVPLYESPDTYCDHYRALVLDLIPNMELYAFCQGNTNYLIIYSDAIDASDAYNDWLEEATKAGHYLWNDKRALWVSTVDSKGVEITHHCTRWGRHLK